MTLALTLLFTINLYRQLSHEKVQQPPRAQDRMKRRVWAQSKSLVCAVCAACASLW